MTTSRLDILALALREVRDPDFAAAALADPGADLFTLGLNSLQAFDVLDRLLESDGVDVDYADFTQNPTLDFLVNA